MISLFGKIQVLYYVSVPYLKVVTCCIVLVIFGDAFLYL